MKESINPGGVKSASASPLRAFSGPPKCTTLGEIGFTYHFDVVWRVPDPGLTNSLGQVVLSPTTGVFHGKPGGKWVAIITLDMKKELPPDLEGFGVINPTSFDLSLIEHPGPGEPGRAAGIIPASGDNSWSPTIFTNDGLLYDGTPFGGYGDPVGQAWVLEYKPEFALDVKGPDLARMAHLDFGTVGKTVTTVILPEQSDFCTTLFYPFLFSAVGFGARTKEQPGWGSMNDGFGNFGNQGIGNVSARDAFPVNPTILGTLTISLFRVQTLALFSFSVRPPLTFVFNNETFYNTGLAPAWHWDFGDGATSAEKNPVHTYATTGTYHVVLSVTDVTGVYTFDQFVILPLKSAFTFTDNSGFPVTRGGVKVIEATFTDNSVGAVNWNWDFGDGSPHYLGQTPPPHDFALGGSYVITLTVGDALGNFASSSKSLTT